MPSSDRRDRARLEYLEWEARNRPHRHALRLFGLVVLGYGYPLFLLAVSLGVVILLISVAPMVWQGISDGRVVIIYAAAVLGALVLAAMILKTFWVELPTPDGQVLKPQDAPLLRQLIEEIRQLAGSPKIHFIYVDVNLNAAVGQRHRFGFWGSRRNHLIIGLPLLLGLSVDQLRVVLAHELGHLRGRHNGFRAWIYRIQRTWESLASPFKAEGRLRRLIMGWFIQWYGAYFSRSTLAVRRLHEYDADRRSAEVSDAASVGHSLVVIAWAAYRLEKMFWPALIRTAGANPLPPADILAMLAEFFNSDTPLEAMDRWRSRERRSRTPVTHEHPCLADRLEALGCRSLLESQAEVAGVLRATRQPQDAAISLLGDCRSRAWNTANASWKAIAIGRWRMEHASAKALQERHKEAVTVCARTVGEAQWEQIQAEARYAHPEMAVALLRRFVGSFPEHASANFTLGRLLLDRDDDGAASCLEAAIRNDSEYILPSLQLLLDYYREAGRDHEADPIRMRLEQHELALVAARKERLKVSRGDRFEPHGLDENQVRDVHRILYRFPQIRAAYLARKHVRLFTDKPSYVLAITRHASLLDDNRRGDKRLIECLHSQMHLPCAIVMLGWTSGPLRTRLLRACPSPVFLAAD